MPDTVEVAPLPGQASWRTASFGALAVATGAAVGMLMLERGQGAPEAAMAGAFSAVLVTLAAYDLALRIVPNQIVYPALGLALALSPVWDDRGPLEALVGAALAFVAGVVVRGLSAGGLGAGDVKMMALVGAIVGVSAVVAAGVVTVFTSGVVALLLIASRRADRQSRIPYAPFITLGGLVAMPW